MVKRAVIGGWLTLLVAFSLGCGHEAESKPTGFESFRLEAVIQAGATTNSLIWLWQQPGLWRWEIDAGPVVASLAAFDGASLYIYKVVDNTYRVVSMSSQPGSPIEGQPVLLQVGPLLLGPTNAPSLAEFMNYLEKTLTITTKASIVGEENLLGKATKIIEYTYSDYLSNNGSQAKLWVDPTTMFVLQEQEYSEDGTVLVTARVTNLTFDANITTDDLVFQPPAGAILQP